MCTSQLTTEIGHQIPNWRSKLTYFKKNQTKKINYMKKYTDFGHKLGKLASNLKMNIMKMGKTLKYEKFMLIFAKMYWKAKIYHKFFGFYHFFHFCIIYLQLSPLI